jgi:hypothetical protein
MWAQLRKLKRDRQFCQRPEMVQIEKPVTLRRLPFSRSCEHDRHKLFLRYLMRWVYQNFNYYWQITTIIYKARESIGSVVPIAIQDLIESLFNRFDDWIITIVSEAC